MAEAKSAPGRGSAGAGIGRYSDLLVGAALTAGLVLTLVWYDSLLRPFWFLLGIWAAMAIAGAVLLRHKAVRTAFLPLAAILTMLFLAEGAFAALDAFSKNTQDETDCTGDRMTDPYLTGYGVQAPVRMACRKHIRGDVIYDITYNFDEHRLRVTPGNPRGDTVLFFGGSDVVGRGVEDDETLPYFLSQALGFRYNVRNFGYGGYGPHQMLYTLERGLPPELVSGRVRRVFFQTSKPHLSRSAGLEVWAQKSPSYEVGPDGEARFVGKSFTWTLPFAQPHVLRSSLLAEWVWSIARDLLRSEVEEQLELFGAILKRASRLSLERFGVPLTVILRDGDDEVSREMHRRFGQLGLETILWSDILTPPQRSQLQVPRDGHPSGEAYRLVAARLAALIE